MLRDQVVRRRPEQYQKEIRFQQDEAQNGDEHCYRCHHRSTNQTSTGIAIGVAMGDGIGTVMGRSGSGNSETKVIEPPTNQYDFYK